MGLQFIKAVGDVTWQRAVEMKISEEQSEMKACSINLNQDRYMFAPSIGLASYQLDDWAVSM